MKNKHSIAMRNQSLRLMRRRSEYRNYKRCLLININDNDNDDNNHDDDDDDNNNNNNNDDDNNNNNNTTSLCTYSGAGRQTWR